MSNQLLNILAVLLQTIQFTVSTQRVLKNAMEDGGDNDCICNWSAGTVSNE